MADIEEIKSKMVAKAHKSAVPAKDLLSTGCTLLNLACSGRPTGGIAKGTAVLLAGTSDSGKTWMGHTILAEAAINKRFKGYRLIFNDPEHGALMDVSRFWPVLDGKIEVRYPSTLEEYYDLVDDDLKRGDPFVQVTDSMDGLVPEADESQFQKEKKARARGRKDEATGSYGTAKAKKNASAYRVVANKVKDSGSVLITIGQLHQNFGYEARFEPETVSGGRALKYYSHLIIWVGQVGSIKKKVNGKNREQGIKVSARIRKNRLTGKKRTVQFPIYWSVGIDDVGSTVEWLLKEGHWSKKKGGVVVCPELGISGTKEGIVKLIEDGNREVELQNVLATAWNSIEDQLVVERKNRYG